jgi:predicted alpha/beta-fold hydrolase
MHMMPDKIHDTDYHLIQTFEQFDNRYTAPIHGFSSAKDYWSKCSCKQFLSGINIPSILINAQDDPFLGEACYPIKEAKNSPHFFLEMPKSGGHVGFIDFNSSGEYWHEKRIAKFVTDNK